MFAITIRTIPRNNAFCLEIFLDGNGLSGLSFLSMLISKKSLKIIPAEKSIPEVTRRYGNKNDSGLTYNEKK